MRARRCGSILAAGLAVVTTLAACGDDSPAESGPRAGAASQAGAASSRAPDATGSTGAANIASTDDPLTGELIGSGCGASASVPAGAGSLEDMAGDPVAVAVSHDPLLTTLASALSGKLNPKVNLVDALNGRDFTVFAPTDAAFAKLGASTRARIKVDGRLLTSVLTRHLVAGQLSPSQLKGTVSPVEGAPLRITGSGNTLKIENAHVVCGGIRTANATVYLIDRVLMPSGS